MTKKKAIISIVLNVLIIIFTVVAISRYYISGGDGNMQVEGNHCLVYYTNLSNIFAALCSAVILPSLIKIVKNGKGEISKLPFILKFIGTVAVSVTFLTCVLFLGPTIGFGYKMAGGKFISGYVFLFAGNVFFLHFLCPVLAIISFIFFETNYAFNKKYKWLGLSTVIVYGAVYYYQVVVLGSENGGWSDFYGFTFGGNMAMVPVSMLMMLAGTFVISLLLFKFNKKANKITVIAATHNKGKMVEISDILKHYNINLISWDDAQLGNLEIDENGTTCEENSFIKANTICQLKGMPALGDDTGLFVDAADGEPGIYAARYAGEDGNDAANRKKLLERLKGVPMEQRTAKFVTVITIVYPDGKKLVARGECPGYIAESEVGERGFGYDSIFIPAGQDKTFAQLPLEYKDKNSHRAKALETLAKML